MSRCDSYYFILLYIIWLLTIIINSFNYFISGETILLDILLRVDLNDTIINSFSFYWTSLFYLPLFLIFLFYIGVFYIQIRNMRLTLILLPICICMYLFFLKTNIIWLEVSYETFLIINSTVNELLLNSLNKYHPFLFYVSSLLLLFTCIIFLNNFERRKLFKTTTTLICEIQLVPKTLLFNMISLFLGSWWALQESTWGGWWNWDASEVFGLLVCFSNLMRLHALHTFNNQYLYYIKYWLWIFIFFLSYGIVQVNFQILSHNFGIEILEVFTSLEFLIPSTIFCFLCPTTLLLMYWKNIRNVTPLLSSNNYYSRFNLGFMFFFYTVFILTIFCISYTPLFEDYLNTNLVYFISLISPTWLILSLAIVIILLVINKDFNHFIIIVVLNIASVSSPINLIILFVLVKYCTIRIMHLFIIILLILNMESANTSYITIDYARFTQEVIDDKIILQPTQVTYTCNSFFLQRIISYSNGISYFNSFSNFYHTSLYNPNNYILIGDSNSFTNFYFRKYGFGMKYYNIKNVALINLVDFTVLATLIMLILTKLTPSIKRYY